MNDRSMAVSPQRSSPSHPNQALEVSPHNPSSTHTNNVRKKKLFTLKTATHQLHILWQYQTLGLSTDRLNVACWCCSMILLSDIPSSIISTVTKPRGSSGSSWETRQELAWVMSIRRRDVSVCLLTYKNMNGDHTAKQQLLHKSHCVPLPCPSHLHKIQMRWETTNFCQLLQH